MPHDFKTDTGGDGDGDDQLVTPETFMEVAWYVYDGETFGTGVCDDGFVFEDSGTFTSIAYVGYRVGDSDFIVGKVIKKSETVGRTDPKLEVRKNEYVEVQLREVTIDTPLEEINVGDVSDAFESGEAIDKGWLHGHRLTPLHRVLDDVFQWHAGSFDFAQYM